MSNRDFLQKAADYAAHNAALPPLGRVDWLEAAVEQFTTKGVNAVRITQLATQLGVSRGSFYWHFKNRADLLQSIVLFWGQKNAQSVIAAVQEATEMGEGMFALYSCWLDVHRFDPQLDMAMRDWARNDPAIKKQVRQADLKCIEAISDFFKRMGVEKIEAITRARTIYFCQIGYYALDLQEPMPQRLQYLEDTFYILAGHRLSPALAQKFRAQFAKE